MRDYGNPRKWKKGHIEPFWSEEDYKTLDYKKQPITEDEVESWKRQGYDYVKSFTGSMYGSDRPIDPKWTDKLHGAFNLTGQTYTFYKMQTLEIMPTHIDRYKKYIELTGTSPVWIRRVLIMLEDWKPGHYLEIDNTGITNWRAGDYFVWENYVPHAASNIGTEDRYTLQITGEEWPDDIWTQLYYFNIPSLPFKKNSEHVEIQLLKKELSNQNKPSFVYPYNGNIKELENIKHDPLVVEELNKTGIDIYLMEPLCSYTIDSRQHTVQFYSEFPGDVDRKTLRAEELDSIQKYMQSNNLNNVTVKTCDYKVLNHYPHYHEACLMKLECDDLFLKTVDYNDEFYLDVPPKFTKKFINLNWRYCLHRHLIAAWIAPLNNSYCSWYFTTNLVSMTKEIWYDLEEWKNNHKEMHDRMIAGLNFLNINAPLNVDLDVIEATPVHKNDFKLLPYDTIDIYKAQQKPKFKIKDFYKDVFCDIVTESRFAQPTANYSEKVMQAMIHKKPFILVAPPYTLQYLQEQGFKTFGQFWDESYDVETDHQKRLLKILNVIDFVDAMTFKLLETIYKDMQPIIEHNYQLCLDKLDLRGKMPKV